MKTFIFKNQFRHRENISSSKRSSSTFKIPEHLYLKVKIRAMSIGGTAKYLRHLLDKYRYLNFSGHLAFSDNAKTLYQAKGQKLKRIDFRPRNEDWSELRMIAQSYGVSATYLFVFFAEIDFGEFGDAVEDMFAGVDPSKITTRAFVFVQSVNKNTGIRTKKLRFGYSRMQVH